CFQILGSRFLTLNFFLSFSQRLRRIDPRGADRRPDAGEDSKESAAAGEQGKRGERQRGAGLRGVERRDAQEKPDGEAKTPADEAQQESLGLKLKNDVVRTSADGPPQPDLLRARNDGSRKKV